MHKQIKISPGVYVVDFRKNATLKGLDNSQLMAQSKDVGLLLDKISNAESKLTHLQYSISAMQQQPDWRTQNVLLQSIEQNYKIMLRFSKEIKEWILELGGLKYKPENDKIEEMLNAERIAVREEKIQKDYEEFLREFCGGQAAADSEEEGEKIAVQVNSQGAMQQSKENKQITQDKNDNKKQDEGIYL